MVGPTLISEIISMHFENVHITVRISDHHKSCNNSFPNILRMIQATQTDGTPNVTDKIYVYKHQFI